jgi:hypothetical protein
MERLAFEGVLVAGGPGRRWTCVKVPVFVPGLFGRRGRIPVLGTVNGHRFRAAIHSGSDGGFFVVVPRLAREAAGIRAGDRVAVTLERDDAARVDSAPGPTPN